MSNGLEKYPKLRFPGFGEPIQAKKLSRYLIENTDRNKALKYDKSDVLSVSGEFGIVNQIAFQGRSFAGESVAEYHIVETDDIVYTKSPLKANPYGIIKVNNGNPGIVSTLYAVYHPIDVIPQYIDYYFCNDLRLNKYLKPLVNIGAKHDMKVNNAAVLFGDVYFPNATEQSKIVEFLQILDYRIKKQRALVESLKKYKRGVIRTLLTPEYCKFKDAKWTSARIGDLGSFSQIGDVIIPTSGETPEEISTASCVMVPGVILGGDLNIFRCSKVDGRIISYILNHVVSRNIARIAQGKSVVHVQANELAKIEIAYPDFKTQENMVTLFEAINAKIAQRTKELELLLEQRRALLQQVFI